MTFDLSRPNFARFTIGLFGYFVTENREDDTQTHRQWQCNATGRGAGEGFVTLFSANVKLPTQSYGCCHDTEMTSIRKHCDVNYFPDERSIKTFLFILGGFREGMSGHHEVRFAA